jgi:hypothetical protein
LKRKKLSCTSDGAIAFHSLLNDEATHHTIKTHYPKEVFYLDKIMHSLHLRVVYERCDYKSEEHSLGITRGD